MQNKEVVIVGGGPCGLLMALYLGKRGYCVEVFEKSDEAKGNRLSQKATELDLSARALSALEEVGLLELVIDVSVDTIGRLITFNNRTDLFIPHGGAPNQVIYNVSRADLHRIFLNRIQTEANIKIHYSHRLVEYKDKQGELIFEHAKTHAIIVKRAERILGCDGVHSVIRTSINSDDDEQKPAIYTHHYKELTIPAPFANQYLQHHYMYKWEGENLAFLAHPKIDHSFSGTLILPAGGRFSFSEMIDAATFEKFLLDNFPIFTPIIGHLTQEFLDRPFGYLSLYHKIKHMTKDNLLLLGDAAHSMLPFLGQGINCAFEDCRLFNGYLQATQDNWKEALKQYAVHRKADTDAIMDMSSNEYQELNPQVSFVREYFIESMKLALHQRFPKLFIPYRHLLYFTHFPYSKIKQEVVKQKALLQRLFELFGRMDAVDWTLVYDELTVSNGKLVESTDY